MSIRFNDDASIEIKIRLYDLNRKNLELSNLEKQLCKFTEKYIAKLEKKLEQNSGSLNYQNSIQNEIYYSLNLDEKNKLRESKHNLKYEIKKLKDEISEKVRIQWLKWQNSWRPKDLCMGQIEVLYKEFCKK